MTQLIAGIRNNGKHVVAVSYRMERTDDMTLAMEPALDRRRLSG